MDDKTPVIIIGGGVIARTHAKWILASPTCFLKAIVDPFDTGKSLASESSAAHFNTLDDLLASPPNARLDQCIYLVCVPNGLHVSIATDVINKVAPKVMMVEKPVSTDSRSGAELLALAKAKGCQITVGHHRRFHPRIAAAKEVVSSGTLGSLTAMTSTACFKKNDGYYTEAPWRASRGAGGGPVWTNIVHDIDVMHYLIGSRIVRLWAKSTKRRREHPDVAADDVIEEGAAVMLEYEDGTIGTLILSDNVASPFSWESATGELAAIAMNDHNLECYRIFGTEGTLTAPDGTIWKYGQDDLANAAKRGIEKGWGVPMTKTAAPLKEGDPYERQIEHLVRVSKGLEDPVCPGDAGLAAVRVCEAICKALEHPGNGPIEI